MLGNIVPRRPDAAGSQTLVDCPTWDNATLLSEMHDPRHGEPFPWVLRMHRIMPGEKNSWYLNVYGTKASARFSLKNPRRIELLEYRGGEQRWERADMGFETSYPTITGGIFEFGAPDAFLQLVAAFMDELATGKARSPWAACPTPAETHFCHRLFTAALRSQASGAAMPLAE